MKRFLLLFCTVALFCAIMIVPASASEVIRAHFVEDHFESFTNFNSLIPSGEYIVSFYVPELDRTFDLGSHDLIIDPYYLTCAPDDPLKDAVIMHFGYFFDDYEFVFDFVWNPSDGVYSLVENDEFISYAAVCFVPVYTEYLDVVVELTPVEPEPISPADAVDAIGAFFQSGLTWFTSVISVISSSPLLLIMVIIMPIVGILIAAISKKT